LHSGNQSRNVTLKSELGGTLSAWELDELMALIRGWGNVRVRGEALQERAHGDQGGITRHYWRLVQQTLRLNCVAVVVYREGMKIRTRPNVGGNFTGLKGGQDVDSSQNARSRVMLDGKLTRCPPEG
jgi:hypothetical protein